MSLRMALLGLLKATGPASGYDLAKLFDSSINNAWKAGHSQIYPELARMTEDGLVTVEADGPRGRKTYTLTDAGWEALRHWLVGREPERHWRSEAALRAFLLPLLDAREAAAWLRREAEYYAERLRSLEELRHADGEEYPMKRAGFGRYALELGISQNRLLRDWALDSAADLERRAAEEENETATGEDAAERRAGD
ncbi:PadR family transcriptional regulator [Bailinhaonella thermotolerans]|uniref:PadR family transcriptional regulator n=1 Tax=Bailinhaonella thermotolerans TaxID=1070861 RepID=A0A3A4A4F9_9ACTN|nr:PadR family transcriptional regulator [Bailinhaonella thermotolerans]RJL23656.1 PadR family transcriptional regulator [Bailinhaonella thermotolerans]